MLLHVRTHRELFVPISREKLMGHDVHMLDCPVHVTQDVEQTRHSPFKA